MGVITDLLTSTVTDFVSFSYTITTSGGSDCVSWLIVEAAATTRQERIELCRTAGAPTLWWWDTGYCGHHTSSGWVVATAGGCILQMWHGKQSLCKSKYIGSYNHNYLEFLYGVTVYLQVSWFMLRRWPISWAKVLPVASAETCLSWTTPTEAEPHIVLRYAIPTVFPLKSLPLQQ